MGVRLCYDSLTDVSAEVCCNVLSDVAKVIECAES
jgi:hypothetical protein